MIHPEAGEVVGESESAGASDTTVLRSVGLAIEDLASARLVYGTTRARASREEPGER